MSETNSTSSPFDAEKIQIQDPLDKGLQSLFSEASVRFSTDKKDKTAKQRNTVAPQALDEEIAALERLVKSVSLKNRTSKSIQDKRDKEARIPTLYQIDLTEEPEFPYGPNRQNSLECQCWIPEERRENLYEKLAFALPLKSALTLSKIHSFAFKYWIERATGAVNRYMEQEVEIPIEDRKYVNFITTINEHIDVAKEVLHKVVHAHGYRDWKAAAFLLERLVPEYRRLAPSIVVNNNTVDTHIGEVKTTKTLNDDLSSYREHFSRIDIVDAEVKQSTILEKARMIEDTSEDNKNGN